MTRVRVLTPAGVAAVAVLALEGRPGAQVALVDGRGVALAWPERGRFKRARLLIDGRFVDDVLVVGKDAQRFELHVHGGAGVVQAVRQSLDPESGRETGSPAGELGVVPRGLRAARARASELHGELARLARVVAAGSASGPNASTREEIHEVLARATYARRLAQPPTVRLVGLPNAGKSTLFNALLLEPRSLVSAAAGTTRDVVSSLVQWAGVTIRLEDTEGGGPVDSDPSGADLLVHVCCSMGEPAPFFERPGVALIRVLGKVDQDTTGTRAGVSGRSGAGVPGLRARILAALGACGTDRDDVLAPLDAELTRLFRQALRVMSPGTEVSGSAAALRRGGYGPERVR